MQRRRGETPHTHNTESMAEAYEVGGSVAPGLQGHIPDSEHNGRWKESVTNGHTSVFIYN